MNPNDMVIQSMNNFFSSLFQGLVTYITTELSDIMGTAERVLDIPLVRNGIAYAQALAFTILVLKVANEAFQTYILYQNGDPDADPSGLLIRTGQAVAVIGGVPWLVEQIFVFGTKITADVSNLGIGRTGFADWGFLVTATLSTFGIVATLLAIVIAILFLIVAIQATIRGAELALMAVLGPIMALNITSNNRNMWSAWIRQVIIVCCSQAIQIFMLSGALSLLTSQVVSSNGLVLVFGWLWVTVKAPKFIQQFAYSTGLTSSIGGTAKQAGSMAVMRMIMTKGA